MAEPEVTENKDESHKTLNPKEVGQLDTQRTEEHQKNCQNVQKVMSCPAEGQKQAHGEEEHSKYFKKPSLQSQTSVEKLLEKTKIEQEKNTNANEGKLAGNKVKEEVPKDPVECSVSQCEKNDSTEERNIKEDGMIDESGKEERHVEKRNQAEGEVKNREFVESEQREEEDEGMARKQTEKSHDPDAKTVEPEENREITGGRSQEEDEEEERKSMCPEEEIDRQTDNQHEPDKGTSTKTAKFKKSKKKAYYVLRTGNTLDSHKGFLKLLHKNFRKLKQVDGAEVCDFILVFCPVVSRAGTDIEAALRQLNTLSDTKHAVLVVLHCTNDPERVMPDSSRAVARKDTCTVDCLFHENDGLYKCSKNDTALKNVTAWIKNKPWKKEK